MVPSLTDLTFSKQGRRRRWDRVRHTSLKKIDQSIIQSGNLMFHGRLSYSLFLLLSKGLEWSLPKFAQHSFELGGCPHQLLNVSKSSDNT
jgi:hypothetical protein